MLMEQMMNYMPLTDGFMMAAVDPFNAVLTLATLLSGWGASGKQRQKEREEKERLANQKAEGHKYVDQETHDQGMDERAIGKAAAKAYAAAGAGAATATTDKAFRRMMDNQSAFSKNREAVNARGHRQVLRDNDRVYDYSGYAAQQGAATASAIGAIKALYGSGTDTVDTTDGTTGDTTTERALGGASPGGYAGDRPVFNAAGDITGRVKGIPTHIPGGEAGKRQAGWDKRAAKLKEIADNGGVAPQRTERMGIMEGEMKTVDGITYVFTGGRWIKNDIGDELSNAGY